MSALARTDKSLLTRWWWTVDRWTLAAIAALILAGAVLTMAASPPVAQRLGLEPFYFANRQFAFLAIAFATMVGASFLSPRGVKRIGAALYIAALALMVLTLFKGVEIKGAVRWIQVGGFSLQPSEFVKPGLAIVAAWMFAERRLDPRFPGYLLSTLVFTAAAGLLLRQPDVGMTLLVSAVWGVQFFLAGLPLFLVVAVGLLFVGGSVAAYFIFPHVQIRVDRFLDPSGGEGYQVARALDAMRNGGFFGRGPGEGQVKGVLPDAHADFVFAVAGEEFGVLVCLLIVALFLFVVLRGFSRTLKDQGLFPLLAVAGLLTQFALQAFINMASAIHLMPPKGMTLPFISYGGSSTIALGIALGFVLALTRDRPDSRLPLRSPLP